MGPKMLGDDAQRCAALRAFSRSMSADDDAPQPRLIDMLEPDLEARDVFLGLLKEGQISGQFRQALDPARSSAARASLRRPRSRPHRAHRSWHGANAPGQTP